MPDATKECPACAFDVPADAETCPYCGYEFPGTARTPYKLIAVLLALLLLWPAFKALAWLLG